MTEIDWNERIYITHTDPDIGGTWVPRSAMRQMGQQGWSETEPPEGATAPGMRRPAQADEAGSDMVKIHHPELDADAMVPRSSLRQHAIGGWVLASDNEPPAPPASYDPTGKTVIEITTYLEGASETERARVIAAEQAGKNRPTVTEWTPKEEEQN